MLVLGAARCQRAPRALCLLAEHGQIGAGLVPHGSAQDCTWTARSARRLIELSRSTFFEVFGREASCLPQGRQTEANRVDRA